MTDIKKYQPHHLDHVLTITRDAFGPVYSKLKEDIPSYVYDAFYPNGCMTRKLAAVEEMCENDEISMWVAITDSSISGFVGLSIQAADSMGEIYILAVHPDFQKRNIGTDLMEFAFDEMRRLGLSIAMVQTGDARGHEPSRAAYSKVGFERYPVARYFKKL
ncbi:MAG: GNAT family N-acetyltransferase [Pseudomonadota bacterium]